MWSLSFFLISAGTPTRGKGWPCLFVRSVYKTGRSYFEHHAGVKLGAHDKQGELIAVAYLLWDRAGRIIFSRGMMKPGGNPGQVSCCAEKLCALPLKRNRLTSLIFAGACLNPLQKSEGSLGQPEPLMKIFNARYKWLDVLYTLTR